MNHDLELEAQIRACVERQSEDDPFSGVIYVTRAEGVLAAISCGDAIRSESIPNRIDTRFQTASGSKILTAVAICKLVESGRLSFDTPLQACVDAAFPHYDPRITVHHLLTHTSGITSYFEEDVNDDYEALWLDLPVYRVRSPRDFLPLFQHKEARFPPGERFEYNDGGFILLGLVIEQVSGQRFQDYVQQHVLAAAGMQDSGYFANDQLPGRTAYAYIQNPDGSWRTNFFAVPIVGAPDGGAYVTAPDLAKFWRALWTNQLLRPEITAQLLHSHVATGLRRPDTHYGYGVWIDQSEGAETRFSVTGFDPGVAMRSISSPTSGVTLTMLGNTQDALWPLYKEVEKRVPWII